MEEAKNDIAPGSVAPALHGSENPDVTTPTNGTVEAKRRQVASDESDQKAALAKAIWWVISATARSYTGLYFGRSEGNTFTRPAEARQTLEESKTLLVKELLSAKIDPIQFDALISSEVNRRLKVQFGIAFLILTMLFTSASYAIVVFNGIFKWGISEVAITGLIIETPIQFVGLLYIIARNLFPRLEQQRP